MTSPVFADPWYVQLVDAVIATPWPLALLLLYWFLRGFVGSLNDVLGAVFRGFDEFIDRHTLPPSTEFDVTAEAGAWLFGTVAGLALYGALSLLIGLPSSGAEFAAYACGYTLAVLVVVVKLRPRVYGVRGRAAP